MPSKMPPCLVRVKNIRIGEKRKDKMHDDEFTPELHRYANKKILARQIYDSWYEGEHEGESFFLHQDWVEVIQKKCSKDALTIGYC